MLEFLLSRGFVPHGYCLQWKPALLWTHVGSDLAIALAYFSIPAMIVYYLRRRTAISDIATPYLLMGGLFAGFIVFCGLTHVFGMLTIWYPLYGAHGVVKLATGVVSVLTAIVMVPVLPRALALRTPEELEAINASLKNEVLRRTEREKELEARNAELRAAMDARTRAEVGQQEAIRSRDELQQTLDQLKLTQARLVQSEKLASMGKSMAGIAHEVNTPVGVSVTAVSVLSEATQLASQQYAANELSHTGLNDYFLKASESLDIVSRNLERAAGLLQSVKQVATDQSSDQPRHLNLREYIQIVLRSLKPNVIASRTPIHVDCPPELGLFTLPGALSQVVINLVTNALTHAYPAGQTGEIRLALRRLENGVELTCSDDGVGIRPENLERVFEPFFTTRAHDGGSGIGLDMVKMLVTEQLGGQIRVTSQPGAGTQFVVELANLKTESAS